jgi:predicted dinucleotide-binding enzyme
VYGSANTPTPSLARPAFTATDHWLMLSPQRKSVSHVVKAFNTIYWEHLRDQGDTSKPLDDRRAIFIAGDSAEAKAVVRELIEGIGFAAVDTGTLAESSVQEPGAAIYGADLTAGVARKVLRE